MKIDEFKDSITYRASCDCTSQDCDMTLDLEVDRKCKMILLSIYKDLHWSSSWGANDNWFLDKWIRIKTSIKMLFTGHVEVQESFIMRDTQIDDFVKALKDGKEKLEKVDFQGEN